MRISLIFILPSLVTKASGSLKVQGFPLLSDIPPVIPGRPPALWVYAANFRFKHGTVPYFESNSMQEARLYHYLLCSKTLEGMRDWNLYVLGMLLLFSVKQPQAHQEEPMWAWKDLGALWPGLLPVGFGFHLQT